MIVSALSCAALAAWLYLTLARGGFWLARERDDAREPLPAPVRWPSVTAVIPARNEADLIGTCFASVLAQDYPGPFQVILVDDHSTDGTDVAARAAATGAGMGGRTEIVAGAPLPPGWTGKLWALAQGVERAALATPDYVLLTDADIRHDRGSVRRLVARAEQGGLALASLMVRLHCKSLPERAMIPTFVYFFQMLFPFAWSNQPNNRTAAGAGGCMLVRREALERIGGIARVRDQIIDDCALATALKTQGPTWLGLTEDVDSLRPYGSLGEIGGMIARSAYAQLGYSPFILAGSVVGLLFLFFTPVAAALFGHDLARWAGLAAWALMALSMQPLLRLYRCSPLWGLALPAIGAIYVWFTLQSALEHWSGRGGMWKGRAQAIGARP